LRRRRSEGNKYRKGEGGESDAVRGEKEKPFFFEKGGGGVKGVGRRRFGVSRGKRGPGQIPGKEKERGHRTSWKKKKKGRKSTPPTYFFGERKNKDETTREKGGRAQADRGKGWGRIVSNKKKKEKKTRGDQEYEGEREKEADHSASVKEKGERGKKKERAPYQQEKTRSCGSMRSEKVCQPSLFPGKRREPLSFAKKGEEEFQKKKKKKTGSTTGKKGGRGTIIRRRNGKKRTGPLRLGEGGGEITCMLTLPTKKVERRKSQLSFCWEGEKRAGQDPSERRAYHSWLGKKENSPGL